MSVLIKGMEMPKNCNECPCSMIGYLTNHCSVLGKFIGFAVGSEGRREDCPLVPVPPHGRLIDADALNNAFTELRWDDEGLAHWGDRNAWCLSGNEVEELFNNAPTVIPADKDGGT